MRIRERILFFYLTEIISSFQIQDGKLNLEFKDIVIKEYSVGEIMCRNNVRPFFTFAQSNSGKSIIGANCVIDAVKQDYSQIIYITQSYNVPNNIFLRNNILKQFVFDPNQYEREDIKQIEFVKFLNNIQRTLEKTNEDQQSTEDIIKKYISKIQQDTIKTKENDYCQKIKYDNPYMELLQSVFSDSKFEADKIFQEIYSQNNFYNFFNKVEGSLETLQNLFANTQNLKIIYQKAEMSKSFAFSLWRNNIRREYNQYKKMIEQTYQSFVIQQFNELLSSDSEEVKLCMQNPFEYKGDSRIKDICNLIQSPVKFCVVFDDISELLQDMMSATKLKYSGRSIATWTQDFIKFVINKGRHYGTFFLAVHSADVIPSPLRGLIGNYIIAPSTIQQFQRQSTSGTLDKPDIVAISQQLDEYNKEHGTFYVLVYFQNQSESIDGNKYAFMQAQYNQKDSFNIQVYKSNPYFYYLAQHQ